MARLPDPRGSFDSEGRATWDRLRARRGERGATIPGVYLTLMHNPAAAERVEQLGDHLRFGGVLPRDVFEFVVLAVATRRDVAYERHHHEPLAREAGVPEAAIAALEGGEDPPEPYLTVLRGVDTFLAHEPLAHDIQDRLSSIVGTDGLVEMAVVVGMYALMGGVIKGFDVVPDDDEAVSA